MFYVLCMMMCLSDFVPDPETKAYVGYGVTGLIAFHLMYSIGMITSTSLFGLKLRCRRKKASSDREK